MEQRGNNIGIETGNGYETDGQNIEEVSTVPTEEEKKGFIRANEEDMIQGLIDAAGFSASEEERKNIEISRKTADGESKVFFRFTIAPLREEQYEQAKKKHTKYVKNKQFGMKLPEETNSTRYRSQLIYMATVDEDREKLWDNKQIWEALRKRGFQIMNGLDVIEYSLKAGEKDRVLEVIDEISGYDSNLEEVAKN